VSTPDYPGGELNGTITNGVGGIYTAVGLNIGSSTKCLVTTQAVVSDFVALSGNAIMYGAWRVNGSAGNNAFNPWCFMSEPSPGSVYYECSNTGVVLPTGSATNTYDFGCYFEFPGGYNTSSAFCHTTVICFP
jgi:hypothetical protein